LVAAELDDGGAESRILLAAPLEAVVVAELIEQGGRVETAVEWNAETGSVKAVERIRLEALVVGERPARSPDPGLVRRAFLDGVARAGVGRLPWSDEARRLRQRLAFLNRLDPSSWPEVSDGALLERLAELLGSVTEVGSLDGLDLTKALLGLLDHGRRSALDRMAPERVLVPTGSKHPIDYSDPETPVLAVRLQELFGETNTPVIADGRVPLTLHLLSPARRPVQVTRDLGGFWRSSYHEVRKDLRGRYPKHDWPEDPLRAVPTRRAKPRK
jgi:ATP-dependent helicase HrpB